MTILRVAAVDPSLRNFGLAKAHIDLSGVSLHSSLPVELISLELISSSSDKKTQKTVRKNSDDLRRARTLYAGLQNFIADVDMVMVEVPVGSQSARSMASYGVCIGVLASISKPLIQITPTEVKLATVGSKTASKEQVIRWAVERYPNADWLTRKVKGEVQMVGKNEHLADAVGALHAGMNTDEFANAVSMLRASSTSGCLRSA